MDPSSADLVPVRDAAELTAGMSVFEMCCDTCKRSHWLILLREDPEGCPVHPGPRLVWEAIWCRSQPTCLAKALAEKRLYRLDRTRMMVQDLRVSIKDSTDALREMGVP